MTQKHIIKKQVLDFTLDSETGSFAFQSMASEVFRTEIVPLIDAYCSELFSDPGIVRIDKLEIDLGVIGRRTFERQFTDKMDRLFPEALAEVFNSGPVGQPAPFSNGGLDSENIITEADRDFELLEYFMKNGRLPWWVTASEVYDIPALLEIYVTGQPLKMKSLVAEITGNTAQLKRLVYHASDSTVEKIIALFQPDHYQEICKVSSGLITILKECSLLTLYGPSKIKPEVYSNILTLAVACEGRVIYYPDIVQTVIRQLAKTTGVDYEKLLNYGVNEIKAKGYDDTDILISPELTGIQAKGRDAFSKISISTAKIDRNTREYIQQLNTIAKLLKELQEVLPGQKTAAGLPLTAEAILDKLSGELPEIITAVEAIIDLIQKLLKKTAQNDILTLKLPEPDEQVERQAREFEEQMGKLHTGLKVVFEQNLLKTHQDLVKTIIESMDSMINKTKKTLYSGGLTDTGTFSDAEEIYVGNAGLILVWPYLSKFFETLGLVTNRGFVDEEASARAVYLLHYLAFGTGEIPEYSLMLNKILCGIDPGVPLKPGFEITETEIAECENLLQAVIFNWPVLRNVTIAGLRSMFLIREGILRIRDGHWALSVENQAYDILLDKIPWGISMVKLPWMPELLFVEWRL